MGRWTRGQSLLPILFGPTGRKFGRIKILKTLSQQIEASWLWGIWKSADGLGQAQWRTPLNRSRSETPVSVLQPGWISGPSERNGIWTLVVNHCISNLVSIGPCLSWGAAKLVSGERMGSRDESTKSRFYKQSTGPTSGSYSTQLIHGWMHASRTASRDQCS